MTEHISINMDSGSVFPTKTPSFEYSNIYPPISFKPPAPFGGGIKYKATNSSLSDEGSLLKVGSFSFCSTVSAYYVSKPMFDIKATEDKTNISTPMLSGSGKNILSYGSMAESASPKISGGGFASYSSTRVPGGFNFVSSKGGVNLRHCPKSIPSMLVVSYWVRQKACDRRCGR